MSTNGNEKADSKLLDIDAIESGLRERLDGAFTRAPSCIHGTSDCVVWRPWDGSSYQIIICEPGCGVLIDTPDGRVVPLGAGNTGDSGGVCIFRTPRFAGERVGYAIDRRCTLDQLEEFLKKSLVIADFEPWMLDSLK